jgi:hypothetical protein
MTDDSRIDAALRDVPVPDGIADHLTPEALFDDAAVDRLLAQVAVPAGLADRVRAGVFTPGPGRGVDLDRAAGILPAAAPGREFDRRRGRWADAAPAVAISLAAVAAAVVLVVESGRRLDPVPARPPVVLAPNGGPDAAGPAEVPIGMLADDTSPALESLDPEPAVAVPEDVPLDDLVVAPADERSPGKPQPPSVRGAAVGAGAGLPVASGGMRIVGPTRGDSRRAVPRAAGFDLAFEMAHGEPPFVDPAAAGLAVDRPPLTIRTDSFDAVVHRGGRRPRAALAADLRTEDILASLPVPVRPRASGPQLSLHAVRSLRKETASFLVEACVVAPALDRPAADRVDAVLVLDRYGGSEPLLWPRMCRAVEAVAAQMREGDRVTVVVGGGRPRVAGSRLDAAALRHLATALAAEPADESSDFDATMRAAAAAGAGRPLVVVANVESVDRARGEGRAAVSAWREALVRSGPDVDRTAAVRFVLVDPAEPAFREPSEPDFGRTPAETRAVTRAVVERVFGVPTLALRQCRLEVAFDPQAVAAYRLVGHRQSAMESLATVPPAAIDLHAGEAARVVYEVVPRSAVGKALVATLACRPIGADGERIVTAALPLRAVEPGPLPGPHGCELLLAAALGELASGSPHAGPRGAAIQAVADLASAWRERGDVTNAGAAVLEACSFTGILKPTKPAPASRR